MKLAKKFSVHNHIDMNTNDFFIEFLPQKNESMYLKSVNINKLDEYKKYSAYQHSRFYMDCRVCKQYHYSSEDIKFNFKTSKINDFKIRIEFVSVSKVISGQSKLLDLTVDHLKNESEFYPNEYSDSIKLPFIKITDKKSLEEKFDTMITFM